MRKPIDIAAELKALDEKAELLKAEHRVQLVELLERTKADQLPAEVLAGLLLDGVAKHAEGDPAADSWRQKGSAFFRRPPRPRRAQTASDAAASGTPQAASAA
ncbi:conjugal transfer protein TraD [Marinivivus vitaminiproducens]|uniref:conjugal transfer protein TraD n=1 Tax=Marinivivus vitaminiproducens TaxID=3035935 RepID=UPI00279DBC8B|nr:conjugal transfer protein TraD [Geminicoccaceae bacterium SCSIO 64248]